MAALMILRGCLCEHLYHAGLRTGPFSLSMLSHHASVLGRYALHLCFDHIPLDPPRPAHPLPGLGDLSGQQRKQGWKSCS